MAAGGKLVRQDETGIWLYLTLAVKKTGLNKDELIRRAGSGELAFRDDLPGKLGWFREEEIAALAKAKIEANWQKPTKPKRAKTEKELAKSLGAKNKLATRRGGGAMAAHSERLTLPRDDRVPKGQR